jgi:uncharacterized protein (TIGR02594 family)
MTAPWMTEAKKFEGLTEIVGSQHEPKIVKFFAEAGHSGVKDDETPWCAAFANAMLSRAGYKGTGQLNARSFLKLDDQIDEPKPGCIVVLKRGNSTWQGHVGFLVSKKGKKLRILGGNQANAVNEKTFNESQVLGYAWPKHKKKSLLKDPVVVGSGSVGAGSAADGGAQINETIETAKNVKDIAKDTGILDTLLPLLYNPRFLWALMAVLVVGGIIYWRWRERQRGNT